MEEWIRIKLSDCCESISDGDHMPPPKVSVGIPFITISNIRDNQVDLSDTFYVPQSYYEALDEKRKPQKGDILYTVVGSFGIPVLIKEETRFVFQRHIAILRPNYRVDSRFLYYCLLSPAFYRIADRLAIGAVQRTIGLKALREQEILIPRRIEEQKRIADILSSIDDKISLNNRINHNLEEQAQALYKSWFVDYEPFKDGKFVESELGMIPEGWMLFTLDNLTSKFGTGLNPRKNFVLGKGTNYYVTIKNMGNNRVYLNDKCDRVDGDALQKISKRSKLMKGDLLFSGIGTIGRVAVVEDDPVNWNTSESVFNMHPRAGISTEFLRQLLLSDSFQEYVMQNAQGGVQQGIRMASLKAFMIALPSESILRKFDEVIHPIISHINSNNRVNDSLSSTRDVLLPRLLSGSFSLVFNG